MDQNLTLRNNEINPLIERAKVLKQQLNRKEITEDLYNSYIKDITNQMKNINAKYPLQNPNNENIVAAKGGKRKSKRSRRSRRSRKSKRARKTNRHRR